jgi:dienelactone hydrolase
MLRRDKVPRAGPRAWADLAAVLGSARAEPPRYPRRPFMTALLAPRLIQARAARLWIPACAVICGIALLACARAQAAPILEQVERLSVRLGSGPHDDERRDMTVTIVREDRVGRRPFIVLEHGRGVDAASRRAVGLQAYPANARYFAERGFVVLVPTRIGYGVSGGPDVEDTGPCTAKRYAPALEAALGETRQLLEHAAALPYVDPARGVILGESFGGLLAVAAAGANLPGVRATVNFAGGDGGDSLRHVDEPCQPERLREAFAALGRTNHLPTLWLYSRNDRFWGPAYPKSWFAAFRAAGGRGEFVELPADKNNGHYIFNRNPPAWQPALARFLDEQGFAVEPSRGP